MTTLDLNQPPDYRAKPAGDRVRFSVPLALAGLRFDRVLASLMPEHSRARIQHWMETGRITVDGQGVTPSARARGGEIVDILCEPDPDTTPDAPEAIPLAVVFEDLVLLVIDKPAGLVVHPGNGNPRGTLLNALLHHAPAVGTLPRAGIVHRLDKDTTGLMVVAKTLAAHTDLVRQLQARTVSREYLALVYGEVDRAGTVDAPLARDPHNRVRRAVHAQGKPAVTHYAPVERFAAGVTLVRCRLETGRTHQIRVHMQHIGHPLVGEPVYTAGRRGAARIPFARQALHAERLGLVHPILGTPCSWTSPLPADFAGLLTHLREDTGWAA